MSGPTDVIADLYNTLLQRRGASPDSSYTAKLYHAGRDAILKKVGEEAAETLIAAKNGARGALVHELADLWFHTLVLMASEGVPLADLTDELARRRGTSGIAEKNSRQATPPAAGVGSK